MNKRNIITWALFFLLFFFIAQSFTKKSDAPAPTPGSVTITPSKSEYVSGEEVIVSVFNNSTAPITIPLNCPKNPLTVTTWDGEKYVEKSAESKVTCKDDEKNLVVAPGESKRVTYSYWNHALFGNIGRYKLQNEVITDKGPVLVSSPEFSVVEPGFFRKLFRTVFYQPLYNVLVFFLSFAGHDLGLAIILLTIFIRLVLLIPSQRAMVSQRRMQELQPKLAEIRKTYEGNQERIAQETLKLWKDQKVSPFGSCLPILLQLPVLIALFSVIQNGMNPDSTYLLYSPLKNVDFSNINTMFLGILDLTKIEYIVMPLLIGALQFFQLKLSMARKSSSSGMSSELESANKMMIYVMPVMIALFSASVPAGVSLYWGVSTLFGIGQQLIVNKKV